MPAEAARLRRRVGPRDRCVLALIVLLAGASIPGAALLHAAGGGSVAGAPGCVRFDQAGVLGGGTWRLCGTRTVAFCHAHAERSGELAARCARLRAAPVTRRDWRKRLSR